MMKVMPRARTATTPVTAAASTLATMARATWTGPIAVHVVATIAAVYAPTPKYAAWPSTGSPVTPVSRLTLIASSPKIRMRDAVEMV